MKITYNFTYYPYLPENPMAFEDANCISFSHQSAGCEVSVGRSHVPRLETSDEELVRVVVIHFKRWKFRY